MLRVLIYDLHIAARDIDTQNKGAVGIVDFKNFGIRKMRGLTPGFLKKVADVLQVLARLPSHQLEPFI